MSFPLNTFITEKEAKFSIEWTWHKNAGAGGLSSETDVKTLEAMYNTEGFQHAPLNPGIKTTAIVQ